MTFQILAVGAICSGTRMEDWTLPRIFLDLDFV